MTIQKCYQKNVDKVLKTIVNAIIGYEFLSERVEKANTSSSRCIFI